LHQYIIITTINPKSKSIVEFEKKNDWKMIIVGDKKSVPISSSKNLTFLSIDDQKKTGFEFEKICPFNHYTRKNIGYLYAIKNDATFRMNLYGQEAIL